MSIQDKFNFAFWGIVCTVFITSIIMMLIILSIYLHDSFKISNNISSVYEQTQNEYMIN